MDNDKAWNYIGKGDYIDGIPARDLTAADWDRLNEDDRAAVERSPLYRRAPRPKIEQPPAEQPGDAKPAAEPEPAEVKPAKQEKKDKE